MRVTVPKTPCRSCGPKGSPRARSRPDRNPAMRFHYVECSRCRMRGPEGVDDGHGLGLWDALPKEGDELVLELEAMFEELKDRNRMLYGEVKSLQRSNGILRQARKDDLAKIRELYGRLGETDGGAA